MKKEKLVLFTTAMLLSLGFFASCGSNNKNEDSGNNDNPGNVTEADENSPVFDKFKGDLERNVEIKVLENDTAIKMGYFDELIKAFNEEYKEYGITAVDANQGEFSDLANSGPYGFGPDVLYQANDVLMKYVDQKHITPLPTSKLEAVSQIPSEAMEAYKGLVNNVKYTFGVPVNIQSGLLYYRKDLLPEDWKTTWDKNNNDVPDMVENFVDLYKFSKERHANNPKEYGFEYSLNDFYFTSGFLFSYGGYVFGNNNRDTKDIGLHKNNAAYGARMLRQFAKEMSVSCQDDSAKLAVSGNMASGKYFASLTTPDVRSVIVDATAKQYQKDEKLTKEEAMAKAEENVVGTVFPDLPSNGDLENPSGEVIPCKQMGGISAYAMSSYTKCPKASLAFINFATSYKMIKLREQILDIAPCRKDVSDESDLLSKQLFERVVSKNISLMPSVSATSQIWTPTSDFFADLAIDVKRKPDKVKYDTLEKIQAGLENVSKKIYDAIHVLGN